MISRELLAGIVAAVERAGGDLDDVKDLVEVWERLERSWQPLVDAMCREARAVSCSRGDGGEAAT
jgi:hypothetical protein